MRTLTRDPLHMNDYTPGSVFQIVENHGRDGWIGAFVLATEIRAWGVQGFVHSIETHDKAARAYIRLRWDEIEFIGRAVLMPADDVPEDSKTSGQSHE